MKKLFIFLVSVAFTTGAATAQPPAPPRSGDKRPPATELKAQGAHVSSSVNDLLHLRFKRAHEKHLAEARRRNKGIVRDVKAIGADVPPRPPAPKVIIK